MRGSMLIGLVFGWSQVLSAVPCLLGGAGVIAGLYLLWTALERWAES